jgi:hypothetical protein
MKKKGAGGCVGLVAGDALVPPFMKAAYDHLGGPVDLLVLGWMLPELGKRGRM